MPRFHFNVDITVEEETAEDALAYLTHLLTLPETTGVAWSLCRPHCVDGDTTEHDTAELYSKSNV